MDIIKIKKLYCILIFFTIIFASISIASAASYSFPQLSIKVSNCQALSGNNSLGVNFNEKLTFDAVISGGFSGSAKITGVKWDFPGKTTKSGAKTYYTFKKVGWHNITVTASTKDTDGNSLGVQNNYKVYVSKKPDLTLTSLTRNIDNKKNILSFTANIKNVGSQTAKSSYITGWYDNPKLKKFTKSAKVKSLKSGESVKVNLKFQVPYKYRNYIKNIKVDSTNKIAESIEDNNQIKFK